MLEFLNSILPIVPPILIIVMVLITRKVILSFLTGIISALLILMDYQNVNGIYDFLAGFKNQIYHGFDLLFDLIFSGEEGSYLGFINNWYVAILFFLFALGILTSLMILSGSTRALSNVLGNVKSPRAAQLIAAILGVFIFIDDYFNALVVGNIAKPLATKQKVSRAKLAYIVDSTAAPICVIAFISTWGAGIIGYMKEPIEKSGLNINATTAFFQAIPFQFYVISALALVFVTIYYNINLGEMRKVENHFQENDVDLSAVESELKNEIDSNNNADLFDVIFPLATLFLGTVITMIITNFEDVPLALIIGGFAAIIGSLVPVIRYIIKGTISITQLGNGVVHGLKSMLKANVILIFAWITASLISELGTSEVLTSIVEKTNLNPNFIPLIIFIFASFMAFATGTSWGTFGILIPLVGGIILDVNPDLFVPVIAATLSGAVFGDHASPISDTTLLSSAGSGCEHGSHFRTQLPYVLTAAVIAVLGYIVFGVFSLFLSPLLSLFVAYIVIVLSFVGFIYLYKNYLNKV